MTLRQSAVVVLLCVAVAAVVGGLIAIVWHLIPEQYSLLMRWIAYGLICIGVQCGCLLVRCMCMRQNDSWCPDADHGGNTGGLTAHTGGPTSRTGGGIVYDPDDKPPAYNQVICDEFSPPPPFLDAVRRESLDEALQAETEVEFLREALEARQAAARRAEMEQRRAQLRQQEDEEDSDSPPCFEEATQNELPSCSTSGHTVAEVETREGASRAGGEVGEQGEDEDNRSDAEAGACLNEGFQAGSDAALDYSDDDVFEADSGAGTELSQSNDNSAKTAAVKTDGDILLAEAIRVEAASKALLHTVIDVQPAEEPQTVTVRPQTVTVSPQSDCELASGPAGVVSDSVVVSVGESDSSATVDRRPEQSVPQR